MTNAKRLVAVLHSRHVADPSSYLLEIAPIPPAPEGEYHAYRLALTRNEDVVYQRQHVIHGWATHLGFSHIHVYRIARAFQKANSIMDARTRVRIYHYREPWSISVGAGFVELVLWGVTHPNPRFGRLLHVGVYLLEDAGGDTSLPRYLFASFVCSPEEAIRFGEELEAECDAAQERRDAMEA